MKSIELTEATASLGESVRDLAGEPLVVSEAGVPIAALVPIDELDLESLALGCNPRFLEVIEKARGQFRQGAGLSTADVRRELGLR